jgi:hypothetical protein
MLRIGKFRFSYHPNLEAMPFINTGGYTPSFDEAILLTLYTPCFDEAILLTL